MQKDMQIIPEATISHAVLILFHPVLSTHFHALTVMESPVQQLFGLFIQQQIVMESDWLQILQFIIKLKCNQPNKEKSNTAQCNKWSIVQSVLVSVTAVHCKTTFLTLLNYLPIDPCLCLFSPFPATLGTLGIWKYLDLCQIKYIYM